MRLQSRRAPPLLRKGNCLQTVPCAVSDSASTSAVLCAASVAHSPHWPCQASADHWTTLPKMPPCCMQGDLPCCCGEHSICPTYTGHSENHRGQHRFVAAVCAAGAGGQESQIVCCAAGDIFAGRSIRFYKTTCAYSDEMPDLQNLGDCCRRLVGSHGMDVQVSVCLKGHHDYNRDIAKVVKCLASHLNGILQCTDSLGVSLQPLLPAAAQLEQVTSHVFDSDSFSLLGQFQALKVLDVIVGHPFELTACLPQLHTLTLRSLEPLLSQLNLQCLFSQASALRQLELGLAWQQEAHYGLDRWDMEALVGLQCQQLDLLTVHTIYIDEHTVKSLARIQSPLKLSIDIYCWSSLRSAPLFTLLARLPNLVSLRLLKLKAASIALWDQREAILPNVQRLEITHVPLHGRDSHLPLQSILSMCPAVKHVCLRGHRKVYHDPPEDYARLWHAFKTCAKLASLTLKSL